MPGLTPKYVIAAGESQSAFRLTTYVNAIAPLVNVFDSYLINSRSGTAAALSQAPQAAIPAPAVVYTRDDSAYPVLTFQTETDVAGPLNYLPARQPDSGDVPAVGGGRHGARRHVPGDRVPERQRQLGVGPGTVRVDDEAAQFGVARDVLA